MQFDRGKHYVFYHCYHLVWSTKYRFKVLRGDVQIRVREITRQVRAENGVEILKVFVSTDHLHIFVSIPPKVAVSELMRRITDRSAFKLFRKFPRLKHRYWGCHFWGRGYFSTTNGAITENIVLQ